jgi:hypothetical protein
MTSKDSARAINFVPHCGQVDLTIEPLDLIPFRMSCHRPSISAGLTSLVQVGQFPDWSDLSIVPSGIFLSMPQKRKTAKNSPARKGSSDSGSTPRAYELSSKKYLTKNCHHTLIQNPKITNKMEPNLRLLRGKQNVPDSVHEKPRSAKEAHPKQSEKKGDRAENESTNRENMTYAMAQDATLATRMAITYRINKREKMGVMAFAELAARFTFQMIVYHPRF